MNVISIVIADDHPIIRDGFETILNLQDDFQVIGTARNGKEAIQLADQSPDVILMDVQMPIMDGIEATKIIKNNYPTVCIIVLTSHPNGNEIEEAISNGASGFLLKDWETERIICSIKEALNGNVQLPSTGTPLTELIDSSSIDSPWNQLGIDLSEREKEIARLLVNGLRNEEIAKKLFLSIGTVKNYVSALYKKLEVRTRREAIVYLHKKITKI